MKTPWLKDDAFLADVQSARREAEALHLWWLGQSGFLLCWRGRALLMDPYLSDSLTEKYAHTDKPHVRMSERVIAPERLDFIDAVTASHGHTDHLDAATLRPLLDASPGLQLVIPESIRGPAAERAGVDAERPLGMNDGDERIVAGFTLHALPSAHETLETDDAGRHRYLGYVVEAGRWRVYHSGDTRRYPGMEQRLRALSVNVALLPINGSASERRVAGNLDAVEAVDVALGAGVALAVPHHYDMFAFNTGDPAEFEAEARRRGLPFRILRLGERLSLQA
jgi:L-ascorbate metabolism protein UlaG (beta-lactamase superfamily)